LIESTEPRDRIDRTEPLPEDPDSFPIPLTIGSGPPLSRWRVSGGPGEGRR
jgi:hypothetical protein